MPIKRPQFLNGEIYLVVIRGVGDSLIFKNKSDYYRGIFSLYEFNDTKPVIIRERRRLRYKTTRELTRERFSGESIRRNKMVEILAFCFMPNHIHLLLRQLKDSGISEFMRKFGAGYVGYFNKKYERKGPLFAKFRAVHIQDDNQLKIIFVYIHTNPISLREPKWKEEGIGDAQKVINFLQDYKWSSYPDYIGGENFPSLTERTFLSTVMGGFEVCKEFVENWIKFKKEIRDFSEITLD